MATKRKRSKAAAKTKPAAKAKPGRQAKDVADLQALIEKLIQAKQRGDEDSREEATEALIEFRERPVSAELRQAAADARAVADNQVMVDSLRLLGEIATRLKAAAPVLTGATTLATSGARNLLLPKLATTADHMLQAVLELQQATDNIKAQLDNAKELGDLPAVLGSVKASLEKLKARAKALQA
jgi:hypothetical protein